MDINEPLTYVFGENAAIDGEWSADWIADTFYYKNTPMQLAFFAAIRDFFWGFLKKLIDLFS